MTPPELVNGLVGRVVFGLPRSEWVPALDRAHHWACTALAAGSDAADWMHVASGVSACLLCLELAHPHHPAAVPEHT